MKIEIRPFSQQDFRRVQQLMEELGYLLDKEELRFNIHRIHRRDGIILVAETDRKVVGCLSAIVNVGLAEGMFGEIVSLVVLEEFRGSGIGGRLVREAEDWLWSQVKKVRIRANSKRLQAHRFYQTLGYKEVKTQISFVKYLSPAEPHPLPKG